MTDGKCTTHGWSAITSATTHSQLAGVLAGFLFTGIVLLFGRTGRDYTQTIGLFTGAFFVLAVNSYEYSLIAGNTPPEATFAEQCALVWSQMMPASGLLAVGGTALTCGVSWLLSDHVEASSITVMPRRRLFHRRQQPPPPIPNRYLNRLAGLLPLNRRGRAGRTRPDPR
ncbi:hypothetical protein ACQP0C_18795 [Nocardia sp. CA-129566]|uniref:hypothetical protein n=1 Tax=Nocardia sp. CA-129566 TaxID=3239976 RepID=UPI003D980319